MHVTALCSRWGLRLKYCFIYEYILSAHTSLSGLDGCRGELKGAPKARDGGGEGGKDTAIGTDTLFFLRYLHAAYVQHQLMVLELGLEQEIIPMKLKFVLKLP